jgi:hypothetical protein
MITLTEPQQQALDAARGEPLHLVDPRTQRDYVLLSADAYDRVQSLLDEGIPRRQLAELIQRNMQDEDAGDPLLNTYLQYRKAP